ncbi:uncharacterized protein LOC113006333 [Solenopsis invicta]|uniref:uncharacterized protein LOC113006333 n=1 Tax=Solenopsis invicta TaxID=13686 RepID=UPI00193D9BE5|nr:uncharacterized protein LOC113006333 [Solenopsis invicta]
MSRSEPSSPHNPERNTSWLHSEPGARARRPDALSPVRVIAEAVQDIRNSVRRNLERHFSSDSASETELPPNVVVEREFPFNELDPSIIQNGYDGSPIPPTDNQPVESIDSNISITLRREFSLSSYDSSVFNPEEFYIAARDPRRMASQSELTPRPDAGDEREVSNAEIDAEIIRLRTASARRRTRQEQPEPQEEQRNILDVLDQVIDGMRALQDRMSRIEIAHYGDQNTSDLRENPEPPGPPEIAYGRTTADIRNSRGPVYTYMKLKEARDMIPTMDGTVRNEVIEFLNASSYAVKEINPQDEDSLLRAILCTKLKGKALHDFQTRDIRTYAQLKQEIETCYLAKRGTAHITNEFNQARQKPGESAQKYGLRVDKLAMELYQSMIEGKRQTPEQRKGILDTIQGLALENFQLGLREEIKLIVRSRNYATLMDAIQGASNEEKLKGVNVKSDKPTDRYREGQHEYKKPKCFKCGKIGHHGRECRTGQNRYHLPRPEKTASANTVEKYCTHCKRTGHKREECWLLHGKPRKDNPRLPRKEKRINIAAANRTGKTHRNKESDESSYSSSDSEEERGKKRARERTVREHQVTQVTCKQRNHNGLDLITLPVREATKETLSLLLDTGATITLIKVGSLKGETKMREERMTLTGVTGHKIHTIGKIRATINIGNQKIRHTMHVVKDDFPIDYEGILGIDFLNKQGAKCDHGKKQVRIGEAIFKLHPHKKFTLNPRSETIIQAVTKSNRIGIVKPEETRPGVFIGSCLVCPADNTCPVSVMNTTGDTVEITMPSVTVEEIKTEDTEHALMLREAAESSNEPAQERKERLSKQLSNKIKFKQKKNGNVPHVPFHPRGRNVTNGESHR